MTKIRVFESWIAEIKIVQTQQEMSIASIKDVLVSRLFKSARASRTSKFRTLPETKIIVSVHHETHEDDNTKVLFFVNLYCLTPSSNTKNFIYALCLIFWDCTREGSLRQLQSNNVCWTWELWEIIPWGQCLQ